MAQTPKQEYILRGAWRRWFYRTPPAPLASRRPGDAYSAWDDDAPDYDAPYTDQYELSYDDSAPQPLWTRRQRILVTVIVIIMLISLLAYTFQGIFIPPPPPPTIVPGPLI